MISRKIKFFSSQGEDIYRLLLKKNALTAKEIAEELHVFPNTIYRAVKQLQEKGFVQALDTYPIIYRVQSEQDALDLYSLHFRQQFQRTFSKRKTKSDLHK